VTAAFYTVTDARFFLGAVGLVNSLRMVGHDESIYALDCGLTRRQRELLEPEVVLVDGPRGVAGNLLKTIAPLRHPADSMVLIDADIVVTRHLGELIERGRRAEVLAFTTGMDRFCPEWGELLGLGPAHPVPYLCSALIFCGGKVGAEIVELMDERMDAVNWELTYWRRNVAGYPLVHADQDLFNAVLATRVAPERIVGLDGRLLAFPPFEGLDLADVRSLRCVNEDGSEPYGVHHWNTKPWLEATYHGIYSRLLRRLLVGDDLALRIPEQMIPVRLRRGPLAWVERARVNSGQRLRYHVLRPLASRARSLAATGRRR
jgi:hypothetical protein